jgi:hypothetical protein
VRKTQNWRTVSFGAFQKHERTSSFYERTGEESTVRKASFFLNFKKIESRSSIRKQVF